MRTVTRRGLDAIKRHEGLRLTPYRDVAGLLTVGYGHLLTRSELSSGKLANGDRWDDGITQDTAEWLLRGDLATAERAVEQYAPGLTDAEFDALVSFVFNVGVEAFAQSTLLKKIRAGQKDDVPQQMMRWVYAGGVRVLGLLRRREAEAALWSSQI